MRREWNCGWKLWLICVERGEASTIVGGSYVVLSDDIRYLYICTWNLWLMWGDGSVDH